MTKLWNLDVIQAKTPNTILSSPRANFLRAVWHWRAEIERERESGDGISEKFGVKKGRGGDGEGFVSVRPVPMAPNERVFLPSFCFCPRCVLPRTKSVKNGHR